MAKASRSNKKQPAFDPSELEDLIFSPAVGKGVGSHLVRDMSTVVNKPPVASLDVTTVGESLRPIVDNNNVPTVDMFQSEEDCQLLISDSSLATVVTADLSTVVSSRAISKGSRTSLPQQPSAKSPQDHKLWITENGDLVANARVRKIRLAQDVINSAEENVYDTLWNARLIQTDERDSCRIVQAGYDYLVKRTRLARKTIQRIVAKLLEKDFIAIETRADIYQRSATVYRVFSYKAVLDKHIKKGRLYVAKMGPGFSYAKPLDALTQISTESNTHLSTVDRYDMASVVKMDMTTMADETTVTVAKIDRPTVVKMSPYLLDSSVLDRTSSSTAIHQELNLYAPADDDAVRELANRCRNLAPDCTEEEIVHFIRVKSALIQKKQGTVYNPLGFLMTVVPRCFTPESLRAYRAEASRSREGKALSDVREEAAMERWRSEQEASLSDPNLSEQEKHLIRLCLGLNTS